VKLLPDTAHERGELEGVVDPEECMHVLCGAPHKT
jgi:hypothetical protein